MAYIVEVHTIRVAYRLESCPWSEEGNQEEGHYENGDGSGPACEGDCTWMDGDRRELDSGSMSEFEPDEYDMEEYGMPLEWAVGMIRKAYPDVNHAPQMRDGTAEEREWMSGSSEDAYRGDMDVTETSVYLRGDWTPAERGEVFRRVTNGTGV